MTASQMIRQLQRGSTCSGPRLPGWKQIRKHRATIWLGFRKPFLFVTGILRPLKIRSKTNSSHCWIAMSSWIVWLARFLWLKLMPSLARTVILAIGTIWEEPEQSGFPDSWVLLNYISTFICFPQEWNEVQACHKDSDTALGPGPYKIKVWGKRTVSKGNHRSCLRSMRKSFIRICRHEFYICFTRSAKYNLRSNQIHFKRRWEKKEEEDKEEAEGFTSAGIFTALWYLATEECD